MEESVVLLSNYGAVGDNERFFIILYASMQLDELQDSTKNVHRKRNRLMAKKRNSPK